MNKSTIESIEWHKDQLFKLLEDGDLFKMESDIHSVKIDLNEIIEKAKKRVWVKPTATKKGYYREQEAGKAEEKGKFGVARAGELVSEIKSMISSGADPGKINRLKAEYGALTGSSTDGAYLVERINEVVSTIRSAQKSGDDAKADKYKKIYHAIT
jgi:hypothetical protein